MLPVVSLHFSPDACNKFCINRYKELADKNSQLKCFFELDHCIYAIYTIFVIQSFRHKGLQRLFEKDDRRKVSAQDVQKLEHILAVLNRAVKTEDMNLPGFRLHPLKGKLKGFCSPTVRANWRETFRIKNGNAYDVDLIDYH